MNQPQRCPLCWQVVNSWQYWRSNNWNLQFFFNTKNGAFDTKNDVFPRLCIVSTNFFIYIVCSMFVRVTVRFSDYSLTVTINHVFVPSDFLSWSSSERGCHGYEQIFPQLTVSFCSCVCCVSTLWCSIYVHIQRYLSLKSLGEPYQVVKRRLYSWIRDVFYVRLHPTLLKPLHVTLREGTYRLVTFVFIIQIMLFPNEEWLWKETGDFQVDS